LFIYYSSDDAIAIYVDINTRIQILDSVSHLPKADKEQCGAFTVSVIFLLIYILNSKNQRDECVLVVWSDDLDHIVPLCNEFEEKLMKLDRRARLVTSPSVITSDSTPVTSTTVSNVNLNEKATAARVLVIVTEAAVATAAWSCHL
jgi:hypothetical protein